MFQQHHGESLSEAWTRFKDLLQKFPHHGLDLWLQIKILYDHVEGTTQKGIDYAADGRLRKLRPYEAWATIERLAQYEDEWWNDTLTSYEMSLNFKNPDIEQLLGIMERKVNALMTDAISLMGKSEKEFMEFSSEVAKRLKERIKENENKPRKIEKITKYPDTKVLEKSAKYNFLENLEKKTFPTPMNLLCEAETKNRAENGAKNKPIKKPEKEEVVEAPSSWPVEYYLKHRINEKLIEGLVDNNRGPVYEAILKKKITKKEDIRGNFEIPCSIGGLKHVNALVDQGSDVNVMPYSTYMKLTDERPAETDIRLQ
ncbi:hypothetical protein Tco_1090529 [Tanacetum coccineum]|uniref:Zinc finger, CCHC-type n=1 Tax=Tanacetum coccineum TaxID=301880 RepID=A0ABQ5I4F6_9ASTR